MKNRILGAVVLLSTTGFFFAQERRISERELPSQVKQSSSKYFGKKNVNTIVKDADITKTSYEIHFQDQTKAEFRKNGELKEAKNPNGLPNTVVPQKVREYVRKNYPNTKVIKWEKSTNKQEIKLNNGMSLEFDRNGRFLKID